jgi:hypothetical protein
MLRSSVFRAMFQHDMRESNSNEIIIPVMRGLANRIFKSGNQIFSPILQDLDFATVRDMVRYVYSGRVADLLDKSDLLLSAADKYDIRVRAETVFFPSLLLFLLPLVIL